MSPGHVCAGSLDTPKLIREAIDALASIGGASGFKPAPANVARCQHRDATWIGLNRPWSGDLRPCVSWPRREYLDVHLRLTAQEKKISMLEEKYSPDQNALNRVSGSIVSLVSCGRAARVCISSAAMKRGCSRLREADLSRQRIGSKTYEHRSAPLRG
jgi:hypothetical protein